MTPAEKQASDRFFDQLDKFGRGVIDGDVAVPFMLESKLPEVVLASIWCVDRFRPRPRTLLTLRLRGIRR